MFPSQKEKTKIHLKESPDGKDLTINTKHTKYVTIGAEIVKEQTIHVRETPDGSTVDTDTKHEINIGFVHRRKTRNSHLVDHSAKKHLEDILKEFESK